LAAARELRGQRCLVSESGPITIYQAVVTDNSVGGVRRVQPVEAGFRSSEGVHIQGAIGMSSGPHALKPRSAVLVLIDRSCQHAVGEVGQVGGDYSGPVDKPVFPVWDAIARIDGFIREPRGPRFR